MTWNSSDQTETLSTLKGVMEGDLPKPLSGVFRLVTPMIGGGAESGTVDKDDLLRASSIVGRLRFCWRAANAHKYSPQELSKIERSLWGSNSEPGRVKVEVVLDPENQESEIHTAQKNCPRVIPNFVGQILLQGGSSFQYLLPGVMFRISIFFPKEDQEDIFATWNAFLILGSAGSRSTRGAGCLAWNKSIMNRQLERVIETHENHHNIPILAGASVYLHKGLEVNLKNFTQAWYTAVNAYQMLSRGIQSDAAKEHLDDICKSDRKNFWEGLGPDDPDLRHGLWRDEFDQLCSHDKLLRASRAEFGLPRSHGQGNPTLNYRSDDGNDAAGRRQSSIWIRPLQIENRIYPAIIVLNFPSLKQGDVCVEGNRNQIVNPSILPPDLLLSDEYKEPISLQELCRHYFTDLGFTQFGGSK